MASLCRCSGWALVAAWRLGCVEALWRRGSCSVVRKPDKPGKPGKPGKPERVPGRNVLCLCSDSDRRARISWPCEVILALDPSSAAT